MWILTEVSVAIHQAHSFRFTTKQGIYGQKGSDDEDDDDEDDDDGRDRLQPNQSM